MTLRCHVGDLAVIVRAYGMKRTPWFPDMVKPVRRGRYQTQCSIGIGFSYWNGERWSNQRHRLEDIRTGHTKGAMQDKQWRGLAKKP